MCLAVSVSVHLILLFLVIFTGHCTASWPKAHSVDWHVKLLLILRPVQGHSLISAEHTITHHQRVDLTN